MLFQERGQGWLLSEASLHPELRLSSSHILDCALVQSAAKKGHKLQKAMKSNQQKKKKNQNKIQEYFSSLPLCMFPTDHSSRREVCML